MTRPSWLGRAVRNRHRHAIEQAPRRWRGGRRDDSARTRRKILISTQVLAPGADVVSRAADRVRSMGFDVGAIRAPTVPAGAERLRLVLHAFNTEAEVLGVARAVREAVDASSSSSSEERLVG